MQIGLSGKIELTKLTLNRWDIALRMITIRDNWVMLLDHLWVYVQLFKRMFRLYLLGVRRFKCCIVLG